MIRALEETGNRGIVGRGFITTGADVGVPVPLIENADHALSDAADLISTHNHDEALVRVGLAPSMIWAVDTDALTATRALADQTGAGGTMHVSETPFEIENSFPTPRLDRREERR